MRFLALLVLLVTTPALCIPALCLSAQQPAATNAAAPDRAGSTQPGAAANTPGQFDYFLLDMPWGPAFCSSIKDVSASCRPQAGFAVHGLWPQNNDGTWPQFCAPTPASSDLARNLDITPDMDLIQHEWTKHGTCSGLADGPYFQAAHRAFAQFTAPLQLIGMNNSRTYTTLYTMNMLYLANPAFPRGSLSLSCRAGHVTSVEACFNKALEPMRCQGLKSCDAQVVTFDPL